MQVSWAGRGAGGLAGAGACPSGVRAGGHRSLEEHDERRSAEERAAANGSERAEERLERVIYWRSAASERVLPLGLYSSADIDESRNHNQSPHLARSLSSTGLHAPFTFTVNL